MSERVRRLAILLGVAVLGVMAAPVPASAQQFIDASEDGGGAFIWFAGMIFVFVALLFTIDRVRRRRGGE